MANVALQDGKVILKDGKVSCSCCAAPPTCCMYPAQALIDGIYTVENLPDELLAFSPSDGTFVTVEKTGGIDPAYIYPANPTITIFIAEYEGIFQWHGPGGLPYGNCLIAESFVLDKFADTYTLNGFTPLTRKSLCEWEYILEEDGEIQAWYYLFFSMPVGSYIQDLVTGFLFERDPVSGKSPVGTYVAYPDGITLTVS